MFNNKLTKKGEVFKNIATANGRRSTWATTINIRTNHHARFSICG
jgi:hypothetical protein